MVCMVQWHPLVSQCISQCVPRLSCITRCLHQHGCLPWPPDHAQAHFSPLWLSCRYDNPDHCDRAHRAVSNRTVQLPGAVNLEAVVLEPEMHLRVDAMTYGAVKKQVAQAVAKARALHPGVTIRVYDRVASAGAMLSIVGQNRGSVRAARNILDRVLTGTKLDVSPQDMELLQTRAGKQFLQGLEATRLIEVGLRAVCSDLQGNASQLHNTVGYCAAASGMHDAW
jgi:hypothetical protein